MRVGKRHWYRETWSSVLIISPPKIPDRNTTRMAFQVGINLGTYELCQLRSVPLTYVLARSGLTLLEEGQAQCCFVS